MGSRRVFFCILMVAGSLFYSWHVRLGIKAEAVRTQQFLQQLETKKETRTAQDVGVPTDTETLGQTSTPLETDLTQMMSDKTDAFTSLDADENLDMADAFLPDEITEEDTTEVPVSPFGFGPYPKLPEGWPADKIWPGISANHELMTRVEVKLVHQGIDVMGSIMENGLVYPMISGTVYVEWAKNSRRKYISDMAGDPDACDRIRAIEEERGVRFTEADLPSDIKVLSYEEGGIDPHTFLDLP